MKKVNTIASRLRRKSAVLFKKPKTILSSVVAFALTAVSVTVELPQYFTVAYAEEAVNASEYYSHTLEDKPLLMEVEEANWDSDSGLSCGKNTSIFIPNIIFGETTVGELKAMYKGIIVSGFEFRGSTHYGLTGDDIVTGIIVQTDNNGVLYGGWNELYNTDTFDFSTDIKVDDSEIIRDIAFSVVVPDVDLDSLGLKLGDTFVINPKAKPVTGGTTGIDGFYHYAFYDEVVEMTVTCGDNGTLCCGDFENADIPNITWENTAMTWKELKSMYAGIKYNKFVIVPSIGEPNDFYWDIDLMTSSMDYAASTWNGNYYNSDQYTFDFISDIYNDIPDENLVRQLGINISMENSAIARLGLKEGDTFTITLDSVDSPEYGENTYEYEGNTFLYEVNNEEVTITGANINNPNVVIPAEINGITVTEIGNMAFSFMYQIQSVVIPEGVKKLGWYAFNTCENLKEATLPESLEYIDSWAFERCKSLETIHIPANVTTVMGGAFAQNDSMTSIICDENNNNYVSVNGVLFTKDMKALIAYPGGIDGEYTVPASVSRIGDAAFYGARGLTAVNILGTLNFIGFEGFAECELLTDVSINDGVDYIGYMAFRNCKGIMTLTVPQSVTNIGDCAFGYEDYGENKLEDFTLRGYKDSAIYYYAFRHDIPFICIGDANSENNPFVDENLIQGDVETNPEADENDKITTIFINPAFNMKDKNEAGVGIDITNIKIKAKEIYDEEGLARASEALGTEIVGKKHYNLLDLTLFNGNKDISNEYDGLVEVIIPIPKGHVDKQFYCYRLVENEDGSMTKEIIPGKRKDGSYVIYLEHFSMYALVGDDTDDTNTTTPSASFYKIDLKTDGHGKASADVKNLEEVEEGTDVTLTATPDSGYKFSKWTIVNGDITIKDNKFTMPESDVEIKAEFAKTSSGSIGGSSGGTRRPSSSSSADESVTVNGKSGGWKDVVATIDSAANYGIITVSGNTNIPAEVIAAAAKKNIKLEVKVSDAFTWVIDAAKVGESFKYLSVADEVITATNKTIKSGEASKDFRVTETKLGTGASIRYNTGASNSGKFANLFKVNGTTLEFVGAVKVDAAGSALFPITAAGVYKIVISDETKLIGDINNSMGINALDAAEMLKKLVMNEVTAEEAAKFDFNGDGKTNALDAATILKWIVKN